jgi:hypothetical protein
MSAHTPGPWAVHKSTRRLTFDVYAGEDGCYRVGEVSNHNAFPQNAANARLIAAAPQLLEALAAIVSSLAEQDEEGLIEHAEPMQKARAAILAATTE